MQNDKWIILGQFSWREVGSLFKNSCNHTHWTTANNLGTLLGIVISPGELQQYEIVNEVKDRKAARDHYWVACKESEKESTLKYLNEP